jgi:DNA-binding NtrC family response regulator
MKGPKRTEIKEDLSYLKLSNIKKLQNQMITIALAKTEGNKQHAADILGIPIETLYSRLRERRADAV